MIINLFLRQLKALVCELLRLLIAGTSTLQICSFEIGWDPGLGCQSPKSRSSLFWGDTTDILV